MVDSTTAGRLRSPRHKDFAGGCNPSAWQPHVDCRACRADWGVNAFILYLSDLRNQTTTNLLSAKRAARQVSPDHSSLFTRTYQTSAVYSITIYINRKSYCATAGAYHDMINLTSAFPPKLFCFKSCSSNHTAHQHICSIVLTLSTAGHGACKGVFPSAAAGFCSSGSIREACQQHNSSICRR